MDGRLYSVEIPVVGLSPCFLISSAETLLSYSILFPETRAVRTIKSRNMYIRDRVCVLPLRIDVIVGCAKRTIDLSGTLMYPYSRFVYRLLLMQIQSSPHSQTLPHTCKG
jgi:hypothetical protein